jgi:prepilin-type N-terminal cleavage/methylation domain-containing protein
MSNCNTKRNGFTLIELSIVIVIIGFLVAGIAVGTNMIKQAELRSVITDLQQNQTAYNNFIGRFNQVPGDMPTASAFWPSTDVNNNKSCASTAENCNGNGDSLIKWDAGITDEELKAWKHLSLAGMIGAGIIQIPNSHDGTITVGDKSPTSRITGAGYIMAGDQIGDDTFSPWDDLRTNAVFIGKPVAGNSLMNGALNPESAFNIDQKIDDGIIVNISGTRYFKGATTGNVRVLTAQDAALAGDVCFNNANLDYNMQETTDACLLGAALN